MTAHPFMWYTVRNFSKITECKSDFILTPGFSPTKRTIQMKLIAFIKNLQMEKKSSRDIERGTKRLINFLTKIPLKNTERKYSNNFKKGKQYKLFIKDERLYRRILATMWKPISGSINGFANLQNSLKCPIISPFY